MPDMTRNPNGSYYCWDCKCIVILFDDDEHTQDDCDHARTTRESQT